MKKFVVTLLVGAFALTACLGSLQARPKYPPLFMEYYKDNAGVSAAAKEAKCNVCHAGESKKVKNEYGKAVGKYLTKAKYNQIKEDEAAAKKYILEGLQKAEGEKGSAGKSYGDLLKAGKLPGGA